MTSRRMMHRFVLWAALVVALSFLVSLAMQLQAQAEDTPMETPAATATETSIPTPTFCPQATPEALWVDPVVSPTDRFTQTITVRLNNADRASVLAPAGVYTWQGAISIDNPALIAIDLLTDTVNDLMVTASVKPWDIGGCHYNGYGLGTTVDRNGGPLSIVQTTVATPVPGHDDRLYLPVVADRCAR